MIKKVQPKVKVEWGESDGICRSAGWFLIPPKGFVFEIQMDDCGCKPYNVKLVREDPSRYPSISLSKYIRRPTTMDEKSCEGMAEEHAEFIKQWYKTVFQHGFKHGVEATQMKLYGPKVEKLFYPDPKTKEQLLKLWALHKRVEESLK